MHGASKFCPDVLQHKFVKSIEIRVLERINEAPRVFSACFLFLHTDMTWVDDWERWTIGNDIFGETFFLDSLALFEVLDIINAAFDIKEFNI